MYEAQSSVSFAVETASHCEEPFGFLESISARVPPEPFQRWLTQCFVTMFALFRSSSSFLVLVSRSSFPVLVYDIHQLFSFNPTTNNSTNSFSPSVFSTALRQGQRGFKLPGICRFHNLTSLGGEEQGLLALVCCY